MGSKGRGLWLGSGRGIGRCRGRGRRPRLFRAVWRGKDGFSDACLGKDTSSAPTAVRLQIIKE